MNGSVLDQPVPIDGENPSPSPVILNSAYSKQQQTIIDLKHDHPEIFSETLFLRPNCIEPVNDSCTFDGQKVKSHLSIASGSGFADVYMMCLSSASLPGDRPLPPQMAMKVVKPNDSYSTREVSLLPALENFLWGDACILQAIRARGSSVVANDEKSTSQRRRVDRLLCHCS